MYFSNHLNRTVILEVVDVLKLEGSLKKVKSEELIIPDAKFAEDLSPITRNPPAPPPPAPCEPVVGLARCPWFQECRDKGTQCKAFQMYVTGKTPMRFMVKHRGFKMTPLK